MKLLQKQTQKINLSGHILDKLIGHSKTFMSIWFYANCVSLSQHIESGQTLGG